MTEGRKQQIISSLEWAEKKPERSVKIDVNCHEDKASLFIYCSKRGRGLRIKEEDGTNFDDMITEEKDRSEKEIFLKLKEKYENEEI